jgi:hypothetical protein
MASTKKARRIERVDPRYSPHIALMTVPEELQDPNYKFRFCLDDPDRIHHLKALGYEVVEDKGGGPVVRGRMILMRCKMEDYEARMKYRQKKASDALVAPRRKLARLGADFSVEVSDETVDRIGPMTEELLREGE